MEVETASCWGAASSCWAPEAGSETAGGREHVRCPSGHDSLMYGSMALSHAVGVSHDL